MKDTTPLTRQQELFGHIEGWQQSGLTQKDYCSGHQISSWVFQYWLRKYRKLQTQPTGFIPIRIESPMAGDIHIHYPNGVEVHLPSDTGVDILESLIRISA